MAEKNIPALKNRLVLAVDDSRPDLQVAEEVLRDAGCTVVTAPDGEEGLRKYYECSPDVVLLDIRMPGLDGLQVCRKIKESGDDFVPVILITAVSAHEMKLQGLNAGADDFLAKPYDAAELIARVAAHARARHLFTQLRRRNEELVAAQKSREELTHMIVHDMKNPLTSIMGHLQLTLTRRELIPPKQSGYLEKALESTQELLAMISRLTAVGVGK
jgi:two-component system sensor histidine kinase/response regulator